MLVVHGVWAEDGLAFWAEDVEGGGPAARMLPPGRVTRNPRWSRT
ncbi:hypothetical protein ACWEPN_42085 [Nonomuraea wenchangensis]